MKTRTQSGVAAVELALIIGPMLIMAFGITELGRALYQYNIVVKASRDAVRYLAQQDLANLSNAELTVVHDTTKALAVCGKTSCTNAVPLLPELTTAKVSLCDYTDPVTGNPRKSVLTGQGTVDVVTVLIGDTCDRVAGSTRDNTKIVHFFSLVPFFIPDINFSPVKTTMASRYS